MTAEEFLAAASLEVQREEGIAPAYRVVQAILRGERLGRSEGSLPGLNERGHMVGGAAPEFVVHRAMEFLLEDAELNRDLSSRNIEACRANIRGREALGASDLTFRELVDALRTAGRIVER